MRHASRKVLYGDISASKGALLAVCPFAFREDSPWVESKGEAAEKGDMFHDAAAALVDDTIPKGPIKNTVWLTRRLVAARKWIDANYVRGWRAEEAYAYDPETGTSTLLGHNIKRAYEAHGRKPHELAGSADIVIPPALGTPVVVADWKTGRFVTDSVWEQMGWLCLFAARHYNVTEAVAYVLHVTEDGVTQTAREFRRDDLNRIEDDLRAQLRAIPDAWPTDGVHCDALYCPARAGCDLYQLRKGTAA